MSSIRWEPGKDLMSLRQAVTRLFDESFVRRSGMAVEIGTGGLLPVDIYQTENDVIVKATVPGIKPDEVHVTVTGNVLTIKGERMPDAEVMEKDYVRKENRYGMFNRTVTLPTEINADLADATFENGILTLRLPKAEQAKPKTIRVQTKGAETVPEAGTAERTIME